MNIDLSGKHAIVTGGSRGIGKAIAEVLREAGATVEALSSEDLDLSDRWQRGTFAPICDILVNNAGAQAFMPALDYSLLQLDRDFELMVATPFDLAKWAARWMKDHGGGKIINIASIVAFIGGRGCIGYDVAKAGLVRLTKGLAVEFAPFNVQVNAVAPGFIATDMLKPLMDDEEHSRVMLGRIPAGRYGEPDEVAKAVLFLASPLSDYITGVCLPVDGGWLAR